MSRLIDADKLKDAVYKSFTPYQREWASTIIIINKAIDAQPTVEAVPVVRGEWIKYGSWGKCSVCGEVIAYRDKSNFCKECGADMRKKV